jgi:hypothetical protein
MHRLNIALAGEYKTKKVDSLLHVNSDGVSDGF